MNSISSYLRGSTAEHNSNDTATGISVERNDDQPPVVDATSPTSGASNQILCPDPSAHYPSQASKLAESSANAGLSQAEFGKASGSSPQYPLDKDGKLSSAGAAASLKHARASDLPSFPVIGIDRQSAAGAAASLGFANQKPFEHWKPDASSHAGKAALLAHDYKMKPLWQPELSAAGSKAALLAHQNGPNLNLWEPEASKEGNSAAGIALRNKQLSPKLDYGYTADGRKNALVAATGAVGRSRSGSTPTPAKPLYPDAHNAPYNALNAATIAHKPSTKLVPEDANLISSDAMQSARVTHYAENVSREMFTEHPPVEPEVEEKRRNDALRGASISMAKQMYAMQQQAIEEAVAGDGGYDAGRSAASVVGSRQPTANIRTPDIREQAMQYIHLQETAQKLAADRLAKIDAEDHGAYRRHYGFSLEPARSRLSIRGRNSTRRSSSEGKRVSVASDDDELRSRRIRHQMSEFQEQVKQVDAKKRQKDRENLLAAAERSVQSKLHAMDERVYAETGKVSPAMLEEWESKARAKAAKESESRMQNHGKVNVGGGKFLDQSEIDRIAAQRVQPTLDEVNHEAEQHRARDEERRLDAEEKKRQAQGEKDRERDLKAEQKRMKDEEKRAAKIKKDEDKLAAKTEKQAKKEEKRKSKEIKREHAAAVGATAGNEPNVASADIEEPQIGQNAVPDEGEGENPKQSTEAVTNSGKAGASPARSSNIPVPSIGNQSASPVPLEPSLTPVTILDKGEQPENRSATSPTSPTAPTSPTKSGRIKGLFSKLHRKSKSSSDAKQPGLITKITHLTHDNTAAAATAEEDSVPDVSSPAAPRSSTAAASTDPKVSHESSGHVSSSARARDSISELTGPHGPSSSTAAAEDEEGDDEGEEEGGSGVSALSAESEEERDGFDEALAPAPHFPSFGKKGGDSPVRETRFREEV
ncbi:MAG: hypothetical protein M1821_001133 [Bathelium mastoideum]|nr:MAG: hypothetical protein M1821_001133 [Bathelium mastoideum]